MELQDYILTALATKTVVFVTHQVEFLPAADLILVLSSWPSILVYHVQNLDVCFPPIGIFNPSFVFN